MSTISQYMVEDADGTETGPFDSFAEADAYAIKASAKVIEYEYEFSDSSLVADHTPTPEGR